MNTYRLIIGLITCGALIIKFVIHIYLNGKKAINKFDFYPNYEFIKIQFLPINDKYDKRYKKNMKIIGNVCYYLGIVGIIILSFWK